MSLSKGKLIVELRDEVMKPSHRFHLEKAFRSFFCDAYKLGENGKQLV